MLRLVRRLVRTVIVLALGAVVGVVLWRRATRAVRPYTPAGVAERAQGSLQSSADGLRRFGSQVRSLAERREVELRASLAANAPALAPLEAPPHRRRRGDGRELRGVPRAG